MTGSRKKGRLTPQQRQEVRDRLRSVDNEGPEGSIARIRRVVSHPPTGGNPRRYRFGLAMVLLAVFQMLMVVVLPDDDRRWTFFGFAWLTLLVGAWQIDKAGKS